MSPSVIGADGASTLPVMTPPPTCQKGQVKPSEVVMLGDSYMDLGNVGPTIMMDANNAMYTHYYLAGAALTPGYGTGQGNIVYQWDNMAVPASSDIKVVIWDGGGNDILINNSQCLTTPLQGDTITIDGEEYLVEQIQADLGGGIRLMLLKAPL